MKYGPLPVDAAAGAILAHSVRGDAGMIRKGMRLTAEHITALKAADVREVIAVRLEVGDVHEDAAASEIAGRVAGEGTRAEPPFTGRANLVAAAAGLVAIDRAGVDRLNAIDPAVTLATVPAYARVAAGEMVATVKIIPFAVPRALVDAALAGAASVSVAPFRARTVGLVATELPSLKPSVMDKTRRLLDERLALAGAKVMREDRVAHHAAAVASALASQKGDDADLLIVFGASAVVDGDDVIPAAIREAGGVVTRIGMPVDPGNLLVLGELGGVPVIGAPGCARSPKENGFDWVLNRILADIPVSSADIAALGVGGLLTEITTRPQPRAPKGPRIAALVLAAGSSRRMGTNKLVATVAGRPLVRIAVETALASRAASVTVVTGHDPGAVETALADLDVAFAYNPDHEQGLSTSLRAGLAALPPDVDGTIVLLADMPEVTAATIDALIAVFDGERIVVPTAERRRGNPVLWPRSRFADLMTLTGDTGGRRIIDGNPAAVREVELGPAVALDIDTPEALAAVGGHVA